MYSVFFSEEISEYVLKYFEKYREYFENLFEDSWIWSEKQIIESYIEESINRHNEIKSLIIKTLKEENILWKTSLNTIVIKWRTKYLFIEWEENISSKYRIISKLEIR